jgi:hypothetical protein
MRPHPVSLAILTVTLALVASAGQAFAGDEAMAPTRAEVKASVLAARAQRELVPAGESQPRALPTAGAARTRDEVRDETTIARLFGMLVPAGEGSPAFAPTASYLARAEVKESTRLARLNGELVPAGEGIGPVEQTARGPVGHREFVALFRR